MEFSFERSRIIGGIGGDGEYWKGLELGQFRLPHCASCGKWIWPAHYRCGECGSWDIAWETLEPRGLIYSWTRTHYAFERVIERKDDVPYVTILAEIPAADGARVMGVLKGGEANLRIGAPVVGSIDAPSPKSKGYAAIRWTISG